MINLKLKKVIASSLLSITLLAFTPIGASAEWRQDSTGWWYTEGSRWATGWRNINGSWYYFYSDGYMAHDTTIQGYKLDSNGAWVITPPTASTTTTKATDRTSNPVQIAIHYGIGLDNKWKCILSSKPDGTAVDLWKTDDQSGRQKWQLIPVNGLKGVYNIKVSNGVDSNRSYLSSNYDGTKVDLWSEDDGSGRQRWRAIPVEHTVKSNSTTYLFEVYGGVSSNRKYLSCTSDGTKVDLWSQDDGSGRQRWAIQSDEWQPVV